MTNTHEHKLPNGQSTASEFDDATRLRERVEELEGLCAELYEMAMELGLPQVFLNKLWTVAARGNEPHAFDVAIAGGSAGVERAAVAHDEPDVRLVHAPGASTSSWSPPRPLMPLPERRRVLIVDDDPVVLDALVRVLSQENYDVISAHSGEEALEKITAPIDLLITDYVMPGMHGRQLAEHVRARNPYVKVLYETGFTDLLFRGRREVEPNAAFIEKPYSVRGLQEAARLALFGYIQPPAAQQST